MNGLGLRNLLDECLGCFVELIFEENYFIVYVLFWKLFILVDISVKFWYLFIKFWIKDLMGKLKKNELFWFVFSIMRDFLNGFVSKLVFVVLEDIISSGILFLR